MVGLSLFSDRRPKPWNMRDIGEERREEWRFAGTPQWWGLWTNPPPPPSTPDGDRTGSLWSSDTTAPETTTNPNSAKTITPLEDKMPHSHIPGEKETTHHQDVIPKQKGYDHQKEGNTPLRRLLPPLGRIPVLVRLHVDRLALDRPRPPSRRRRRNGHGQTPPRCHGIRVHGHALPARESPRAIAKVPPCRAAVHRPPFPRSTSSPGLPHYPHLPWPACPRQTWLPHARHAAQHHSADHPVPSRAKLVAGAGATRESPVAPVAHPLRWLGWGIGATVSPLCWLGESVGASVPPLLLEGLHAASLLLLSLLLQHLMLHHLLVLHLLHLLLLLLLYLLLLLLLVPRLLLIPLMLPVVSRLPGGRVLRREDTGEIIARVVQAPQKFCIMYRDGRLTRLLVLVPAKRAPTSANISRAPSPAPHGAVCPIHPSPRHVSNN